MKIKTKPQRFKAAVTLALSLLLTSGWQGLGQTASSLTEQQIEASETKTALQALMRENAKLEQQLEEKHKSLTSLQKHFAAVTAEAEVFKRKVTELTFRLEALGLDSAGEPAKLEQRLLKAVNDLRLSEEERQSYHQALVELSEAVLRFQSVAVSEDAEARLILEAAMRNAGKALGVSVDEAIEGTPIPATLTDGAVISVKEDLALVVANLGRVHGVKVGMPLQIRRGEDEIGVVRVVDVRERISGAVIQDLRSETEKVLVGDRLKVGAER
jgi:hypothetical protein